MPYLSTASGKCISGESIKKGHESSPYIDEPSTEFNHLNSIIIKLNNDNRPHAVINILGQQLTGLLDSGANCSLLGGSYTKMIDDLKLRKITFNGAMRTADGTEHHIEAYTIIPITYNGRCETIPALLLPTLPDCLILGMNFWNAFGVKAVCCAAKVESEENTRQTTETSKQLSIYTNIPITSISATQNPKSSGTSLCPGTSSMKLIKK